MTENSVGSRRAPRVRAKIFGGFMIFLALTLITLVVLQIILLPYIYTAIRLRELHDSSAAIVRSADKVGSDGIYAVSKRLSDEHKLEVLLVDIDKSNREKLSAADMPECVLYDIPYSDIYNGIYESVKDETQPRLFSVIGKPSSEGTSQPSQSTVLRPGTEESYQIEPYEMKLADYVGNIICATVFESNGSEYMLLVNAYLTPIGAATQALTIILIAVGVLMTLLALVLAYYISRRVAGPIVSINDRAKCFAQGRYQPIFDENSGYREVDELSATLNHAANELSKVDSLQKELIANVSHDLRTPLTLIGGYSEMMRDIPGEVTPENLSVIIAETERLGSLVSDLLEISKIQSGVVTPQYECICLTDELYKLAKTYTTLIEREGYKLSVDADRQVYVNADRSLIVRAIMNLINNAMTYTGVDKLVAIRQLVTQDGFVRVEVTDSGDGIAPDKLGLIWERYYKVDAEHKRAAKGTGLGLSIVRSIVTMHKGRYGVRSTLHHGSTFWIEIACCMDEKVGK